MKALADEAPVYEKPTARPAWQDALEAFDPAHAARAGRARRAVLLDLLGLAGHRVQGVGVPAVRPAGRDQHAGPAGLGRRGAADQGHPEGGGRHDRLAMRASSISIRGAGRRWRWPRRRGTSPSAARGPLGLTDCLNFGSPERPEILWQFKEAVEGIGEACRALEIPVVGGNVSFYNETLGQAILPTPVIGMVGLIDDAERRCTQWFSAAGDRVALLGPDRGQPGRLGVPLGPASARGRPAGAPRPRPRARACRRPAGRPSEPGSFDRRTTLRGWRRGGAGGGLRQRAACRVGAEVDLPASAVGAARSAVRGGAVAYRGIGTAGASSGRSSG